MGIKVAGGATHTFPSIGMHSVVTCIIREMNSIHQLSDISPVATCDARAVKCDCIPPGQCRQDRRRFDRLWT